MLNEERFLALQAQRVRSRLRQTMGAWRDETEAAFDLRAAIRRRPWWSLAGATLGGFVAGAVLGRRPRAAVAAVERAGPFASVARRGHRLLRGAVDMLALVGLRDALPGSKAEPVAAPPAAAVPADAAAVD